jgi:hypothetical protein
MEDINKEYKQYKKKIKLIGYKYISLFIIMFFLSFIACIFFFIFICLIINLLFN